MTTPYVEYGFASGSANTVRPTEVTYPDGREIALDYGSAGSMADALSRVAAIVDDDNTHLADYAYLGERSFVTSDLAQPDVKWTLASLTGTNDPDTGDIYTGLDRFGRVKDNRWYDYGASADADRIKYGYDRAGNRTWRQNTVADAQGKHFDELYGNDLIHRLKELARGTLNGPKDGVTSQAFAECWSLDPTGNWKKFLEDTNGDGTWNLDQARTSNPVNEITGITESAGPSWATPAYSAAGNMTTVPQPIDPTKTYTATYDAWNRLVKLVDDDTDDTVAEYQYDGASRRIVQKSYAAGVLDETRHLYYTQPDQWQVVEERVEDETDPERQFVWGHRYVDDLILRDRDTNGDGSLNERMFALQDANWNLTALIDTSSDVQERYAYSAYGTPLFLTPSFGSRASSSFGWETLYAGYRWETLTELFHVRHRVLSSALGTWCQRDPATRNLGSIDDPYTHLFSHLYAYSLSDPLSTRDPTGAIWTWDYRVPDPYYDIDYHGKWGGCNDFDDCINLLAKLQKWLTAGAIRSYELRTLGLKGLGGDIRRYNNHIRQLRNANLQVSICWTYILIECRCWTIPRPYPWPIPIYIPEPIPIPPPVVPRGVPEPDIFGTLLVGSLFVMLVLTPIPGDELIVAPAGLAALGLL